MRWANALLQSDVAPRRPAAAQRGFPSAGVHGASMLSRGHLAGRVPASVSDIKENIR
jgi:hypothetical protein